MTALLSIQLIKQLSCTYQIPFQLTYDLSPFFFITSSTLFDLHLQFLFIKHCMKKGIFVLRKFVKRTEEIIFSLVSVLFRFTGISYFRNFPSNENVRKQHLSANSYSCVNMRFSYMIAVHKDGIFYVVL